MLHIQARRSPYATILAALLCFAVLALWLGPAKAPSVAAQTPTNYVLVKLTPQAWQAPQLALSGYPLSHVERLHVPGWARIAIAADRASALVSLGDDPAVQAIEEDHRVRAAITPDDPNWPRQWGPQIVRAPSAWDIHTGSPSVVVAVLDTGLDLQHPDLSGQLWTNAGEIPGNEVDDDANGYVDDVYGWNILDGGSNAVDDDHGHGTHVSGIIAARGNNGLGIAGMAWNSRLMIVKVLAQNGEGTYSGLAEGLTYAADNGAQIANLSLGGSAPSQLLQEAIDYAHARGMLIVAAAGNSNADIQYPAASDHTLAVAASTSSDLRASYSCYGPEMDLTAPGSLIYSTCMGGGYCYKSGTSMAAPHVAGLAAVLLAQRPGLTPEQITQRLAETAHDLGEPGWDPYTGWGRIDAYAALATRLEFNYYFPIVGAYRDSPGT
jgi:subtilisin family serine protease